MIAQYWSLIRTGHNTTDILDHMYNFRWSGARGSFEKMIRYIRESERDHFHINGAIGVLLRHRETDELKYFYTGRNNFNLLDRNRLITTGEDARKLIDDLDDLDLTEKFSRDDTKWGLAAITNVFFVTPLKTFVAGCTGIKLPMQIRHKRRNILAFQYDRSKNQFQDLCFFRCLAYTIDNGDYSRASTTREYCKKKNIPPNAWQFPGLPFNDLLLCEKLFQIDIQLFNLTKNGAGCWRMVIPQYNRLMNLDVCVLKDQRVHYSLIKDMRAYAKRYYCPSCSQGFRKIEKLKVHVRRHCRNGETKHTFPGGVFQNKPTIFQQLEDDAEIRVAAAEHKCCEFIAVYDFEAIQIPKDEVGIKEAAKLRFSNFHKPVSYAIQSNVPGHDDTKYFVHKEPRKLIARSCCINFSISDAQYDILVHRYRYIFEQLNEKIEQVDEECMHLKEQEKNNYREKGYYNFLVKLKNKLDRYCQQLTILGFNSKRYDLNVIKLELLPKIVKAMRRDDAAAANR